jgi:Protein ENHANCED DISEASE RESISTANCE 2, C-terminal
MLLYKHFHRTRSILGGQLLKQPTLAINFRFPWGYMNLYFEVPTKLAVYMNDDNSRNNNTVRTTIDPSFSVAEQTLAKWLLGDTNYKNERLKLIPYVAEGPWVVRNMVTGRPAIIGKKLPVTYQFTPATPNSDQKPLLTATLDIGNSSASAKRIVSVCRRYMSALTVDIGFVIQGNCAAELPEQMLGAMRVHGPDPLKAPKLN